MRTPFAVIAAALLAVGACSPFGGTEGSEESAAKPDRAAGEVALVQIVPTRDAPCALRWDGQPIAENALSGRAFQILDAFVQQAGGPEYMREFPRIVLEAPQATRYDCFRGPLDALTSSGFAEIVLRVTERGRGADWLMRSPMPPAGAAQRPFATVDLRADGTMLVDGEPVAPAMRRTRLGETAVAPQDVGMTDGSLLVRAEPGTTFGSLHELVGLVMEARREVHVQPPGEVTAPPPPVNAESPAR